MPTIRIYRTLRLLKGHERREGEVIKFEYEAADEKELTKEFDTDFIPPDFDTIYADGMFMSPYRIVWDLDEELVEMWMGEDDYDYEDRYREAIEILLARGWKEVE